MPEITRHPVYPHLASKKWGWTLRLQGAQSVLYDGDEMLSWPTREAALKWARSHGYRIAEEAEIDDRR